MKSTTNNELKSSGQEPGSDWGRKLQLTPNLRIETQQDFEGYRTTGNQPAVAFNLILDMRNT